MKNYDYIRFMTEEMCKLINNSYDKTPKVKKDTSKEWFGMIPFSLKMLFFH